MAYQIEYTQKARQSIANVLDYLDSQWSEKVEIKFAFKLDRYINMLAIGTLEGRVAKKRNDVKTILITKQNRLYYREKKTQYKSYFFGIIAKIRQEIHTIKGVKTVTSSPHNSYKNSCPRQ